MLWIVPVMFSAAQKAFRSGNQVFISAGASVPGVFWNTIRTPSTVSSSMSSVMTTFGAIRPTVAVGDGLADRLVDVAERAAIQQGPVLVEQPPVHGIAGVHGLRHRVLQEPDRGDQLDLAAGDVGLVDDAADAAEVVRVGVRVHDGDDGAVPEVLGDQGVGGSGGLLAGQRVEHDPAGVGPDEADVRQVEAADLVDVARDHLVQAVGHVEDACRCSDGWTLSKSCPSSRKS